MNKYFVDILESIKSNQFSGSIFTPDEQNWELAKSWYHKYSNVEEISDKELLNLLYLFYTHENLDFSDNVHFDQVAHSICEKYEIDRCNFLNMIVDFRKLIYSV